MSHRKDINISQDVGINDRHTLLSSNGGDLPHVNNYLPNNSGDT